MELTHLTCGLEGDYSLLGWNATKFTKQMKLDVLEILLLYDLE